MKFQIINKFQGDLLWDDEKIVDEIVQEFDLGIMDPSLDEFFSEKIIKNAKMLGYLLGDTKEVEIQYSDIARSVTEVKGGYRIALKKGAKLNEVPIFNFPPLRLKSDRIDSITGDPLAQIFPYENERWILLHPVNTEIFLDYEKAAHKETIKKYVSNGKVNADVYEELLVNLELLNINERCAQTLIHEYGHILHWKQFDSMFNEFWEHLGASAKDYDKAYNALVLTWFEESNYLYNVSSRYPFFKCKSIHEKVRILKESFAEDYRISLNIEATDGKIILPNSQCLLGDWMKPQLMEEGVAIVKQMIKGIEKYHGSNNIKSYENEYNRIDTLLELDEQVRNTNWEPDSDTLTRFEGKNLIEEALKEAGLNCFQEVAVTSPR